MTETNADGHDQDGPEGHKDNARLAITIAALGIVFGDIGTSPLYAFRESFLGGPPLDTSHDHILGVLSLIIWSLILVISCKYLFFVMRADNDGEGGIIALVSLLYRGENPDSALVKILAVFGLFGAALLYGDGTITPAISVLSAVEGLEVVTEAASHYVLPITVVILIVLFSIQYRGTMIIGRIFGPVMLVWFLLLALLGIRGIFLEPSVLQAFSPQWAINFLANEHWTAVLVMGAVFLSVTGGEALYADMGHFGISPIRRAWFFVVFPALLLNYLGQGALVLTDSKEIYHPFYHLAPDWMLIPLVIAATFATVIASQAVISGVFSLTRQAINLDRLPRMRIVQTTEQEYGQIYVPVVNWLLMIATILLVIGFGSSERLASAYGLAIAMDMVITTILAAYVLSHRGMNLAVVLLAAAVFVLIDLTFLTANITKLREGGWYPVMLAMMVMSVMVLWYSGRQRIHKSLKAERESMGHFLQRMEGSAKRTDGVGVFDSQSVAKQGAPRVMVRMFEQLGAMPRVIVLFRHEVVTRPFVNPDERIELRELSPSVFVIKARYGFMERLNVPDCIYGSLAGKVDLHDLPIAYFLGTDVIVAAEGPGAWGVVPRALFRFLFVNTHHPHDQYNIPYDKVVEVGLQVPI